MGKPRDLQEIINDYEELRSSFSSSNRNGSINKEALLEFQHKFIDLKADLRDWHTKMLHFAENRSDKGATAIKMRIAISMVKGQYTFKDGETPMYEKAPSISNADKFAAATEEYKEFLKQRTFYKESFTNVADLREDINSYITLIRDKHNR